MIGWTLKREIDDLQKRIKLAIDNIKELKYELSKTNSFNAKTLNLTEGSSEKALLYLEQFFTKIKCSDKVEEAYDIFIEQMKSIQDKN